MTTPPSSESKSTLSAPGLRVMIVAEDPLVRSGLAMLVQSSGSVVPSVIVAQLASRDDLTGAVVTAQPEVALWDLGSDPKLVADRLRDLGHLALPVVALLPDDQFVTEAIAAGATGALLRGVDGVALVAALHAAARGLVVLDPALSAAAFPVRERPGGALAEDLTAREVQVLQLLAVGLANKTIAQRLGISDHTVKFHVNAIMTKLGVQSRTEAVVRAARLGLVIL